MVGLVIHFAITLTAKVLMTCDRAIPWSEQHQKITGVSWGEGDRTKKALKVMAKHQSPTSRILQYKSSILPERIIWSKHSAKRDPQPGEKSRAFARALGSATDEDTSGGLGHCARSAGLVWLLSATGAA
jgi:hypothetical protein